MCFNPLLSFVVEWFAWKVLNRDSDIKGCAEGVSAAFMYVYTMHVVKGRRDGLILDAGVEQLATESIQGNVVPFLSKHFKYRTLLRWQGL